MLTIILLAVGLAAFWLFGMSAIFQSTLWQRSHHKVTAYNFWVRSLKLLADATGGNRAAVKPLLCQLNAGVLIGLQYLGAGAAIMTKSDGDPNGIWFQANTRQAVGKFTLKTTDSWLYPTVCLANYGAATLTNFWIVNFGIPSKNADNTWSVTVQFYGAAGGAAPALIDPILADVVFFQFLMRNSLLNP